MIYYDSWDLKCKSPFGAVCINNPVTFNIICDGVEKALFCFAEKEIEMTKNKDGFTYTASFEESGLVFYSFKLISDKGITVYTLNNGCGKASFGINDSKKFQLTVHKQINVPEWYKKGIVYQIFPDRFNIGGEMRKYKSDCFYYDDWYATPEYIKDENNDIVKWDFFGGNLHGITEKIPYLKSLNVSVLYLNPIFEACSNHRYNTGDYMKIDSVLGDENDFNELVSECEKNGIKIILDGVFNHTGADSIYFNKFGHYNTLGAYQSEQSPYYDWYTFTEYPDEYESWWGVKDLPSVNEDNQGYLDFIINDTNSVIKKWTKTGIGGWRLDVADELPDEFLQKLYKAVKEVNSDTIVLGEVWEDASNKIAYGKLKKYFTEHELDCVMNYPFKDNFMLFLKNKITSEQLKNRFMTQMENYPAQSFAGNFNLIGSHDVERILTIAEQICPDNPVKLLKLIVMCQFVFPGVPCIYYGDEAGLTGGKDPDNRKTYPWGRENAEILEFYKKATSLRANSEALKSGTAEFDCPDDNIFGVIRKLGRKSVVFYINRGEKTTFESSYLKKEITLGEKEFYYE